MDRQLGELVAPTFTIDLIATPAYAFRRVGVRTRPLALPLSLGGLLDPATAERV
jgi:hypothetical protein